MATKKKDEIKTPAVFENTLGIDDEIVQRMIARRSKRRENFHANLVRIKEINISFYESSRKKETPVKVSKKDRIEGDGFVFVSTGQQPPVFDDSPQVSDIALEQDENLRIDDANVVNMQSDLQASEALNETSFENTSLSSLSVDATEMNQTENLVSDNHEAQGNENVLFDNDIADNTGNVVLSTDSGELESQFFETGNNGLEEDLQESAFSLSDNLNDQNKIVETDVDSKNKGEYENAIEENIVWREVDDMSLGFSEDFMIKYDSKSYISQLRSKLSAEEEPETYADTKYDISENGENLIDRVYLKTNNSDFSLKHETLEYPLVLCTQKITFREYFNDKIMGLKSHKYTAEKVFEKIIYSTTYPKKIIKMRDIKFKNIYFWATVCAIFPVFGYVAFTFTNRSMPLFAKCCLKGAALGTIIFVVGFLSVIFLFTGTLPSVFL